MPQTKLLNIGDMSQAAEILRAGGTVAFPTETVYGLGANATNDKAVANIYAAKNRPSFNPLIVHVPDLETAKTLADFDSTALKLADAFWPGALTLVVPIKFGSPISKLVTAGLETVAIRVPNHPVAKDLLRACKIPLAAPSANPSGKISPTTAAHVLQGLDGQVDAVLNGGECSVGLESTIIGVSPEPTMLRPGGVSVEEIEAVLERPLAKHTGGINAPGQIQSHYAPNSNIRLNVTTPNAGESYLGFGSSPCTLNLSRNKDLIEAAANLFRHLHELDSLGKPIAVAPIPNHGLGVAINDRLARAAAPRSD